MSDTKTVTVTLTGRAGFVDRVLRVLRHTQRLGNWGASRWIVFFVDGDGWDRLKTDIGDLKWEGYESNLLRADTTLFDYAVQVSTDPDGREKP